MVIKALILPPGLQLLLLLVGWLLVARFSSSLRAKRVGYLLVGVSFSSLLYLSLPVSVERIFKGLEIYPAVNAQQVRAFEGQAIVILSAGRDRDAPEWGRDVSGAHTAMRLRYGVKLYRQYQLPLLLSGGSFSTEGRSMAEVMAEDLRDDFQVSAQWLEPNSRNTWENAQFSSQRLAQEGIRRVILVTEAWHMRRAVGAFEHFGVEVLPAPTGFLHGKPISAVRHFLPSAGSLLDSRIGLHEYFGLLYYWLLAHR